MKQLALVLALTGSCVFATTVATTPASALETYEAQMEASDAASQARVDMLDAFGPKVLKPGQYVWHDVPESAGPGLTWGIGSSGNAGSGPAVHGAGVIVRGESEAIICDKSGVVEG